MDRCSAPLIKLPDEHQTERKVPANPPPRESCSTGDSRQFDGRQAVQDSVPEVPADDPVAGKRCEGADGETGKPVTLDIGDEHRVLGYARKRRDQTRDFVECEVMQQHRRQHNVEAAGTERQRESVGAQMVDRRETARLGDSAGHGVAMAVERDDVERATRLARPAHQPASDLAAATTHVQHPDLLGRQPRCKHGEAGNDGSRTAAEAIGRGKLTERPPGSLGGGTEDLGAFEARWRDPDRHGLPEGSLSGFGSPIKHVSSSGARIGKRSAEVQIVLNPRAGQGRGLALIEPLLSGLRRRGYRPSVLLTRDRTHALRWARDCAQPPNYLICLAGDDTLDDLAGVAIRHQIPIISVPLGFGNVFPQAFGHRADVPAILDLLEVDRRLDVDVGLWQGADGAARFFIAVSIYGFLETIKAMGEERIDHGGRVHRTTDYLLAAVKWLSWRQPLPAAAIEVDGEIVVEQAALAIVANLPVFPGKLVFSHDADPLDGLLDVCVVLGRSKRALCTALFGLLIDAPGGTQRVLRRKGRIVRIRPAGGASHPPGQNGGAETLTILPRALPVLVPSSGAR